MEMYEIRVGGDRVGRVLSQLNDYAAVRRARALVKWSQAFEVWRSGACIYATTGKEPAPANV